MKRTAPSLAILFLLFASAVYADDIQTPSGVLIIPDGSQVTSLALIAPGYNNIGIYQVNFQFPGGTGVNAGDWIDGDGGSITFTTPVTNLSFTALLGGEAGILEADNGFYFGCVGNCGTFSETFAGPISFIELGSSDSDAGIESMSFTASDPPPVSTPEPSTIGLVLAGFVAFALWQLSGDIAKALRFAASKVKVVVLR